MAEIRLSQGEAEQLIGMPKHRLDASEQKYPSLGGRISVPLYSPNRNESFVLDVTRSRIELAKCTHQNRVEQAIVLLRLDVGGPPHRNPDDTEVGPDHLHIYREGYADKFAIPLPSELASIEDRWDLLHRFMDYCNIVEPPIFQRELFI